MIVLLPCYALVALYCGAYTLHCFQKKHWLPAVTALVLTLLPLASGAVLLYLL